MNNNEWQPIETAPKDGTIILVCKNKQYVKKAYWFKKHNKWALVERKEDYTDFVYPFYWIPLPKPPQK